MGQIAKIAICTQGYFSLWVHITIFAICTQGVNSDFCYSHPEVFSLWVRIVKFTIHTLGANSNFHYSHPNFALTDISTRARVEMSVSANNNLFLVHLYSKYNDNSCHNIISTSNKRKKIIWNKKVFRHLIFSSSIQFICPNFMCKDFFSWCDCK